MNYPFPNIPNSLQKDWKTDRTFTAFNAPEIAVFDSPTSHYRMRAEFRIWHDKGDFITLCLIKAPLQRYRVDEFPIALRTD